MWVLSPFIFAENTLAEIAHLVVPTGWFLPAAATCFFLFLFFVFFSKMGVCLTFFVGSGVSSRLTYISVRLNLYSEYWSTSATGATRFPAVILAALVLIPPLPHPWGNKGRNQCCLFCQWSWHALKGLELVTVHVCCVMWEVLTEICENMEIIVI